MKGAVIYRGEKYFTFLKKIFDSIENVQKNYNWLITGYECYPQNIKYVERLSKEWCWITGKELTKMIEKENFQWIWGVFSAFPQSVTKDDVLKYELPKADGNEKIWKNCAYGYCVCSTYHSDVPLSVFLLCTDHKRDTVACRAAERIFRSSGYTFS